MRAGDIADAWIGSPLNAQVAPVGAEQLLDELDRVNRVVDRAAIFVVGVPGPIGKEAAWARDRGETRLESLRLGLPPQRAAREQRNLCPRRGVNDSRGVGEAIGERLIDEHRFARSDCSE